MFLIIDVLVKILSWQCTTKCLFISYVGMLSGYKKQKEKYQQ